MTDNRYGPATAVGYTCRFRPVIGERPVHLPFRLRTRFLVLAGLIGMIVIAVGTQAALRVWQSTATTEEIGDRLLPAVDLLGDLRATMTRVRLGATRVLDAPDPRALAKARDRNDARIAEMQGLIRDVAALLSARPDSAASMTAFTGQWQAYLETQHGAFALVVGGEAARARAAFNGPANTLYDTAWKSPRRPEGIREPGPPGLPPGRPARPARRR